MNPGLEQGVERTDRRTLFRRAAATGLLGATAGPGAFAAIGTTTPAAATRTGPAGPLPRVRQAGELRGEMLYRPLGRTGEMVSAIGFGGSHFCKPGIDEATSLRLCHSAIDRGMTFTGHKDPRIHLYMMEVARAHDFQFDVALMPSNVMDAHFRSFGRFAMPVALREGIGVITMKPFGGLDGVILKSGTAIQPIDCLHYALNRPTSVVSTGIDNDLALDQAFNAVKSFSPMSETVEARILDATADQAGAGHFELLKTTDHFDGTAHHPDWLGGDTAETAALAPKNGG